MVHMKYWWVRGGFLEGIIAFESGGQAGAYRKDVKQRRAPVGGVCANPIGGRNSQHRYGNHKPLGSLWSLLSVHRAG